ncbi:MAG TPA: transglutaminase-like domain-containing protein, partial [Mycobacteriales bacterium]|nr:transglutaminase-like domain-containing protein [Mycobacteriales bacterium]
RYEPSAEQLDTAGFVAHGDVPSDYLELPSTISPQVIALAESITSKAKSPFSKALAIQSYLTGPTFHYDTTVAGSDSTDALEQFLLVSKRGFCQQFSASMAVLARIVQIPSRVAVGFTHGVRQPDGSWLVTTHDAHAWPELFFSGFGWLPFEPTPRNDGQAITPVFARTDNSNPNSDVRSKTPNLKPSTAPSLSAADRKQLDKPTAPATAPTAKPKHSHRSWWWLVPAVLALLLPVPGLSRSIERRRRWRLATTGTQTAHAAWSELRASAIDTGIDWVDGVTPRASARLLSAEHGVDGAARDALSRIVRAEERARYAAVPDASARDELRTDVSTVSHALTAGQPWLRHAMSVVAPRSTLRSARRMFSVLADGLDYLDAAGARLRARVQLPRWSS